MEIINRDRFFEISENFAVLPFTQTEGYYRMLALWGGENIKFFADNAENPLVCLFAHEKKFSGKRMLIIEGECFPTENLSKKTFTALKNFYENLKNLGYDIIEIQSNAKWNFQYETALRQAGFLRPVGLFSMPATRIVHLDEPIEMDRNWKRNLNKAANAGLTFEACSVPTTEDVKNFCSIYNEMSGRKGFGHKLSEAQISNLLGDKKFLLFFVKQAAVPLSAIIACSDSAELNAQGIYAASRRSALENGAAFFAYSSMFQYFTERKYKTYDMAKLLPSDKDFGSVFQFKNGIGGEDVPLNGEFSWCKKSYYRPLLYFVKKYLMKKREI
jgi:hypothetical protein